MKNIKIGLVGEAPNDVDSIRHLLSKSHSELQYINFLNNINGSQLDSQKTKRFLRIEYESKRPDIVIFIRDLDGLKTDKDQLNKRKEYFKEFNSVVDKKGIFLLHIYEIECLFFFNISVFNSEYGCNVDFNTQPELIREPKEYLKNFTNKYSEIHNSEIFKKININELLNCEYFSLFYKKFVSTINSLNIQ